MEHYYNVYQDRPYIWHDRYPYVYVCRMHTPTGNPSKCFGHLRWVKSEHPLSETYIRETYPSLFKPKRKGQTVAGPYRYHQPR